MEVSMPTRAMIPKAMIPMVSHDRSLWLFIDSTAILIFSETSSFMNADL
jgi:hypothetical protein